MFTGLVEHMGRVSDVQTVDESESGGGGWSMTIGDATSVLDDCHIGDSTSCNGACLTVTEFVKDSFKVGIAPETLRRTNLGDLKVGGLVNLERAMGAHGRFGGHMVQGHVDDVVTIKKREQDGNTIRLTFEVAAHESSQSASPLLPYIVEKGFITLDGASLTVTEVSDQDRTFGVMLISHTQAKIDLANKAVGQRVNVEVDMVGKYVEKSVLAALAGTGSSAIQSQIEAAVRKALAST